MPLSLLVSAAGTGTHTGTISGRPPLRAGFADTGFVLYFNRNTEDQDQNQL
jgi:hypothetical protein